MIVLFGGGLGGGGPGFGQRLPDEDLASDRPEAWALLELVPEQSVLEADVSATAHSFVAQVTQFTGTVSVDRGTGLPVAGRLRFDFGNVTTGIARRDREMLGWLDYSKYPYAEARLVSVERTPTGIVARCILQMHGRENEVEAPIRAMSQDGGWIIEGEAAVDHRRWGLPNIRRFVFLTVDPVLKVHFRLRFVPVEAPKIPPP